MDPRRFDSLVRSFALVKTRRGLLGSLAALGAGLFGSSAMHAQVTQRDCGNKVCAANPAVCANGCVCCGWSNGNSRCVPSGSCSGTIRPPATTTPPPAPAIRMIPILQESQCTATFFADYFPAGDYNVTLVRDGGSPQLLNEVTIAAGETVVQVLVYTYLLDPGTPGSITVTDGTFSRSFDFEFSCA